MSAYRLRRLRSFVRHYLHKLCRLIGYCPTCGCKVNVTSIGRALCPICRR